MNELILIVLAAMGVGLTLAALYARSSMSKLHESLVPVRQGIYQSRKSRQIVQVIGANKEFIYVVSGKNCININRQSFDDDYIFIG